MKQSKFIHEEIPLLSWQQITENAALSTVTERGFAGAECGASKFAHIMKKETLIALYEFTAGFELIPQLV